MRPDGMERDETERDGMGTRGDEVGREGIIYRIYHPDHLPYNLDNLRHGPSR